MGVHIRNSEAADLPDLVRIYNHYVVHTHVTFDIEPFTTAQRRGWFDSFTGGALRLLVAEIDGRVSGYASSGRLRTKPGYRTSVETTVYVDADRLGHGVGRQLYTELFALLAREKDLHRAYAAIALPNAASIALHERFDFSHVGTQTEVGYKLGRYWDVAWYERALP